MDLFELHHVDDRPVMLERRSVLLIEPCISGAGTFLRLGPLDMPLDLHVREEYDFVKTEVTMSQTERLMRDFADSQNDPAPF